MSHKFTSMGWLRLVGSLQLYVSFAEYRLFYRALLQMRPILLRSLLFVAITYHPNTHMDDEYGLAQQDRLNYRSLLQKSPLQKNCILHKRPMTLSIQLTISTPYHTCDRSLIVGSIKLQVSFAKEPSKRDYILQKRRIILWILLIIATPQLALWPQWTGNVK